MLAKTRKYRRKVLPPVNDVLPLQIQIITEIQTSKDRNTFTAVALEQ